MNKIILFLITALSVLVLVSGCTQTETQDNEINQSNITIKVGFDEITEPERNQNETSDESNQDVIVLGDNESNSFFEWETDTVKLNDDSLTVIGLATRAGSDRFVINQIFIETSLEIDPTTYITTKQHSNVGLFEYNSELDCDSITALFKARNAFFGTKIEGDKTTLCFSPIRDIYQYDKIELTIQNDYNELLFNNTIEAPRLLRSTQTVILYES